MCVDNAHEDQAIVTLESIRGKDIDDVQKIIFVLDQPSDRFVEYVQDVIGNCMVVRIEDDLVAHLPEPYSSKSEDEKKHVALKLAMLHGLAIVTDMGYNTAIYLDTNVLVQEDISELFRAQLNDAYLAAASARPYGNSSIRHFYNKYEENFEERQKMTSKSEHYFNSGVIIWNIDKLYDDNIINDDFIRGGYRALRHDVIPVQDYLNRFFNGRAIVKMPRTFSATPCETIIPFVAYNMSVGHNIKLSCSAIINYTDRFVPWNRSIPKDKFFL
jgi:hypothetical protein